MIIDSHREDARRVLVVQRLGALPAEGGRLLRVRHDDKVEGPPRLVEAGVGVHLVELDVELVRVPGVREVGEPNAEALVGVGREL